MNVSAPKFDQKNKPQKRARSMNMAELVEALEASVALPTRIRNKDDEVESDYESGDDADNYYYRTPINQDDQECHQQECEREVCKRRYTRVVEDLVEPRRESPIPTMRRYKKPDKRRINAKRRIARFYPSTNDVEMSADSLDY